MVCILERITCKHLSKDFVLNCNSLLPDNFQAKAIPGIIKYINKVHPCIIGAQVNAYLIYTFISHNSIDDVPEGTVNRKG